VVFSGASIDAEVRWGEQTHDEMMVGFFDVAVPAGVDKQHFFIRKKRATTSSLSDLHQGTGEGQLGRVRHCYLQIDYAPRRNLGARKPLC